MRRLLTVCSLALLAALPLRGAVAVGDVKVSQVTTAVPPVYTDRFTTPQPNTLWGFDSSGRPVVVTIGVNLLLSGNVLIASGGGGGGSVSTVSGTPNEVTVSPTTGFVVVSLPNALTFTGKTVTGGTFTGGTFTSATYNGITLTGSSTPSLAVTGTSTVSGVNTGDQTTITGNAGSATVLQTARTINGVSFNGSANITVTAAASTLTGNTLSGTVINSSLTTAAGGTFGSAAFTNSNAYEAALGNPGVNGYVLSSTTAGVRSWIAMSGGGGTWGTITGTLSDQLDLQAALDGKVNALSPITGATKTKITYTSGGLVTAGADATTADIADSTNRRYVTDAQLVVVGNTSGTNTGDQTSVTGNAGTATALQTGRTINGTTFDGTANITVTAAAGTLTGSTLNSSVTASSLTSVGTLATLTVTAPISGSVTGASGSTTGNAATATALQTARLINTVSFDGTADITVTAAAGTLTGSTLAAGVTASSLTSAAGGTFGTAAYTAASAYEAALGNPGVNGYVLSSTTGGVRSWIAAGSGSGTVTTVSVVTANGISGSVATATTTPAITLTLGAINPTSIGATTPGTGAFTTIAGTFASILGGAGADAILDLDNTSGGTSKSSLVRFKKAGTTVAYVGTAGGAGQVVTGSADGDGVWRNVSGKIMWSVDNGSTAAAQLTSTGFNSTAIGATTASTGKFTTMTAGDVQITSDTISTLTTDADLTVAPNGIGRLHYAYSNTILANFGILHSDDPSAPVSGVVEIINAGSVDPGQNGFIRLKRSRGTISSPTAVVANDYLGSLSGMGHDGTAYGWHSDVAVFLVADGNFTTSSHPTRVDIFTTATSSLSKRVVASFTKAGNLLLGTAVETDVVAGGIKGTGSAGFLYGGFGGLAPSTSTALLVSKAGVSTPNAVWYANAGAPVFVAVSEGATGTTDNPNIVFGHAGAASNVRGVFTGRRSRGTLASPAILQSGDYVFSLLMSGYDGAAFLNNAAINAITDGVPALNSVPTAIFFETGITSRSEAMRISSLRNLLINTTSETHLGAGVLGIGNASTVPSANPTSGSVVYAQSGALKARGSSGTVTTIANADPHCPICHTDYVHEWDSDKYGYLAICINCQTKGVLSFTRKRGAWKTHD